MLSKLFMILCNKCPNCGMPLVDEMACDYCDWRK
jgi:hypothetical protein